MKQQLTESFFEPGWQSVDLSYDLIVLSLPLVEISGATMLQFCVDYELDELLELSLWLLEDQFQVCLKEPVGL